jgi:hypothetical protein
LAYTSPFDLKPVGGHFGDGEGESLSFFLATGFLTTGFLVGVGDLVAETLGVGDLVAP